MLELSLDIDLPAGISRDDVIECVERVLREKIEDFNVEISRSRALESDSELETFLLKFYGYKISTPIVRASTYQNILRNQEIRGFGCWNDPRRPVFMKGAKELLQNKYSTKSAYAHDVVYRYLKFIKFTSFQRDHARDFIINVCHRVSYYMRDQPQYLWNGIGVFDKSDTCRIWLRGSEIKTTRHQYAYIRKLCDLAGKAESLQRKLEVIAA